MTDGACVSRTVLGARAAALDTAAAAGTTEDMGPLVHSYPRARPAQARDHAESSLVRAQRVGKLRVRPTRPQYPLRLFRRRQVHLIRALADYGPQERVGFSLDVNHPFSLRQALRQGGVLLAQTGVLNGLRLGLTTALGLERYPGGALLAPVGK